MVASGSRSGRFPPVVFLVGEDAYLRKQYLDRLRKESPDPCNHEYFDGAECSAGQVISACLTLPFGSGLRLVIVRGADALLPGGSDILLEYMDNPSPTARLVLNFDKPDRRSKLFRAAAERGLICDCSPRKEGELRSWLQQTVRDACGKELTPDAARLLIELIGTDMNTLANEAEKLSLFVGDRKRVRPEDVEEIVVSAREPDIWALVAAVSDKDEARALRVCSAVVKRTSDVGGVLGLLRWNINRLWAGREMIKRGASGREIGRRLKVRGYQLNDFMARARSLREKELYRGYRLLLQADWQVKSGQGNPRGILERLIISLCT